jgi:hypothetical protein
LVPYIELDRRLIPPIEKYEKLIEWIMSFGIIPFGIAIIAYFFSRLFQMHNIIAKFIGLRSFWDKHFIIKPLVRKARSQVPLTSGNVKKIMEFYYQKIKAIDPHYVKLFWNYAFCFWIMFEHTVVVFITLLILSIMNLNVTLLWVWGYFLVLTILTAIQLFLVTGKKSTDQANQIPDNVITDFFNTQFNS